MFNRQRFCSTRQTLRRDDEVIRYDNTFNGKRVSVRPYRDLEPGEIGTC